LLENTLKLKQLPCFSCAPLYFICCLMA